MQLIEVKRTSGHQIRAGLVTERNSSAIKQKGAQGKIF